MILSRSISFMLLGLLCGAWPVHAAGAWYLMAPPEDSFDSSREVGRQRVLSEAPLGRWSRIATFDSAEACERSRADTVRFLTREDQNRTFSEAGAMLSRDRSLLSQCVPSDDPRLK